MKNQIIYKKIEEIRPYENNPLSFLQKDERRIRLVNIIGAVLFVIYGIMISSLSVWILNAVLIVIHLSRLIRGF